MSCSIRGDRKLWQGFWTLAEFVLDAKREGAARCQKDAHELLTLRVIKLLSLQRQADTIQSHFSHPDQRCGQQGRDRLLPWQENCLCVQGQNAQEGL